MTLYVSLTGANVVRKMTLYVSLTGALWTLSRVSPYQGQKHLHQSWEEIRWNLNTKHRLKTIFAKIVIPITTKTSLQGPSLVAACISQAENEFNVISKQPIKWFYISGWKFLCSLINSTFITGHRFAFMIEEVSMTGTGKVAGSCHFM